jgi:hypothetical protein
MLVTVFPAFRVFDLICVVGGARTGCNSIIITVLHILGPCNSGVCCLYAYFLWCIMVACSMAEELAAISCRMHASVVSVYIQLHPWIWSGFCVSGQCS